MSRRKITKETIFEEAGDSKYKFEMSENTEIQKCQNSFHWDSCCCLGQVSLTWAPSKIFNIRRLDPCTFLKLQFIGMTMISKLT